MLLFPLHKLRMHHWQYNYNQQIPVQKNLKSPTILNSVNQCSYSGANVGSLLSLTVSLCSPDVWYLWNWLGQSALMCCTSKKWQYLGNMANNISMSTWFYKQMWQAGNVIIFLFTFPKWWHFLTPLSCVTCILCMKYCGCFLNGKRGKNSHKLILYGRQWYWENNANKIIMQIGATTPHMYW